MAWEKQALFPENPKLFSLPCGVAGEGWQALGLRLLYFSDRTEPAGRGICASPDIRQAPPEGDACILHRICGNVRSFAHPMVQDGTVPGALAKDTAQAEQGSGSVALSDRPAHLRRQTGVARSG